MTVYILCNAYSQALIDPDISGHTGHKELMSGQPCKHPKTEKYSLLAIFGLINIF